MRLSAACALLAPALLAPAFSGRAFHATLGFAPAAAAAKAPAPFRILPGPYDKDGPSGPGAPVASRFTLRGVTVAVELLLGESRAAFIKSLDPKATDPFAPPPGRPELYRTFLLAFENNAPVEVTFQPGNVVLVTDRDEQQFPIDTSALYLAEARRGVTDPQPVLDRVAPLIFESSTTIPSGGHLERLLVFGPLPEKWKEFRLHFSYLQIGPETHTVSFTFHKQPLKG